MGWVEVTMTVPELTKAHLTDGIPLSDITFESHRTMANTEIIITDRRHSADPFESLKADLVSHHIEGIAREGNTPFNCALISQIDGNLWQGGCRNGVNLRGVFKHIISLYPWERYNPGRELDSFVEVRLYDGPKVPDEQQLYHLAHWINVCRSHGPTLVHCQAGLNRSGLLAGLALMLGGKTADEAITLLRLSRSPAVLCNKTFEGWLREQRIRS